MKMFVYVCLSAPLSDWKLQDANHSTQTLAQAQLASFSDCPLSSQDCNQYNNALPNLKKRLFPFAVLVPALSVLLNFEFL